MKCQACEQAATVTVRDELVSEEWDLCNFHAQKMLHSTLDAFSVSKGVTQGWSDMRLRYICHSIEAAEYAFEGK